jgi:hypothetical protein
MILIDPRGSKLIGFLLPLLAIVILLFFLMGDIIWSLTCHRAKIVWTSYLFIVTEVRFYIKEGHTKIRFLLFTIDKLLAVFKNESHMELKLPFIYVMVFYCA